MAVPVVPAVAVSGTGVGAAGVWHAAARLHVHLPRLRQTQSPADTQTLQGNASVSTNTVQQTTLSGRKSKPDADHQKFKGIDLLLDNVWIKWVKSQKDWTLPSRLTCIHPRKPCRIFPSGAAKPPTLTVFSLDSRSFPSTSILA